MRKLTYLVLLFCLVFLMLPGGRALAAEPTAAERGLEMIQTARNWQSIRLPQEENYLETWKTLYPRKAWHAPNLPVMSAPEVKSGLPNAPYVFEGMEVTVVAEENDMSCMLYRAPSYKLYVGWIQSIRLLEAFPGKQLAVGQEKDTGFEPCSEPVLQWANMCYPGTDQRYTVLDESIHDCVGFTYEYQVIDENNARPDAVSGPRTIYVHDGTRWVSVGTFPYTELGTVRVQVWLDAPMDVTAIANVADCTGSNLITVRQTAYDFLVSSAKEA